MGLIDNMQQLREDEFDEVVRSGGLPGVEASRSAAEDQTEDEVEYAPGADDTYDPVRTYLAALGAVPLLKREQEVALAKQIERGEKLVMTAVSRSPVSIEAMIRTAEELRSGARSIKNVIQIEGDAPSAEKTELRRTLKVMSEVSRLYSLAQRQAQRVGRRRSARRRVSSLARRRGRNPPRLNSRNVSPFETARLIQLTRAAPDPSLAISRAAS